MPKPKRPGCIVCGKKFTPTRSDAVTCSSACRQRAYRLRKNPHRWKASANDCAYDKEHEKAFPSDTDQEQRRNARAWQFAEAMRLAKENALLRPGTGRQEIKRTHINEALKVANAWKRLAAELHRRLISGDQANSRTSRRSRGSSE